MKGLILFADGFEDAEGITTRDALMRGKVEVITASISDTTTVVTSHQLIIKTDILLKDANLNNYQFLILPGGLKGVNNLSSSNKVIETIKYFIEHSKDVYAICAAPSILGKLGYLDHKPFTCYPGFEKGINGEYTNAPVTITSEHIITAKSMAYSLEFALAILIKLMGEKTANHVNKSTKGL